MPRVVIVLVLALVPACTLIEAYPPLPEICDNEIDDDGDGIVDCRGDPCRGTPACNEEGVYRCTNGYDDDGDELADMQDATCWPNADVTLERCASVLGGTAITTAWAGNTQLGTAHGFHAGPVVAIGEPEYPPLPAARSVAQLAGDLEGLTASLEIYVPATPEADPLARGLDISLFDATTYRDISYQFVVHLYPAATGVSATVVAHAPSGDRGTDEHQDWAPVGAWWSLHLEIADGMLRVSTTGGSGEVLEVPVPLDFPPSRALVIGASATAQTDLVPVFSMVSQVTMHREPYERCRTDDPPAGITPPIGRDDAPMSGTVSYELLSSLVEAPDGSLCGLVYEGADDATSVAALRRVSDAWSARSIGLTGIDHVVSLPSGGLPNALDGSAIALDAMRGDAWALVTTLRDGVVDLRSLHAQGDACEGWQEVGLIGLPEVPERAFARVPPVAYEVDGGAHAITMLMLTPRDLNPIPAELRTFRSPTGAPGSFVADPQPDTSLTDALDAARPGRFQSMDILRIRRIGRDRVAVVRRWNGVIELWVERAAGWARVPDVELAPSGEEATFDADTLVRGELIESSSSPSKWRGELFYAGLYDIVTPLATSPSGFGPAHISFRAPPETR